MSSLKRISLCLEAKHTPDPFFSSRTVDEMACIYGFGSFVELKKYLLSLKKDDIPVKILDIPGGPSPFCSQLSEHPKITAISGDIKYGISNDSMEDLLNFEQVRFTTFRNQKKVIFSQSYSKNLELGNDLEQSRQRTRQEFLNQYDLNNHFFKWMDITKLPYEAKEFDVVFCGNLLFQSEGLGKAFHDRATAELLRVTKKELRIYPWQINAAGSTAIFGRSFREKLKTMEGITVEEVDVIKDVRAFLCNDKALVIQMTN